MTKNSFKTETRAIKKAAEDHLRHLNREIEKSGRPATRSHERSLTAFETIITATERFDRENEGSSESFDVILKKDAKIAFERACKAQIALRERVERAKENKGDKIVDMAFGDPDLKGGFKPLTTAQYDAAIKILSVQPPDFKDVYLGYNSKWSRSSADDLTTTGETIDELLKDTEGRLLRDANKKAQLKKHIRLWPAFVGAETETQALTFMHEYIGHVLAGTKDDKTYWDSNNIKGTRYLKPHLKPTYEEAEAFFNQESSIKRLFVADTWAFAANEALKASERASQKKPPSVSATSLRMPGTASKELPDWTLVFREKGNAGGQFSLRVLSRFVGPEETSIVLSGWQIATDMPHNHAPIEKFGSVKIVPDLVRTKQTGEVCFCLAISTMSPQDFLAQVLALQKDPAVFAQKMKEESTATPEQPYGRDVIAILALPAAVSHFELFEREMPLKLAVIGQVFFANGPSKTWEVEFVPPEPVR